MNYKTSYFLVGQQRTHNYEIKHHILWSPKKAKDGSDRYKAMRLVKPGDIIFHGYRKKIHAVSIARTSHESANRPKGLPKNWSKNGWKIKLITYLITFPLDTHKLSKNKYNGFYNSGPHVGNITQGYLKLLNKNSSKYLYNNLDPKTIKKIIITRSNLLKNLILSQNPKPYTVTHKDTSVNKKAPTHHKKHYKSHNSHNSSLSPKQSKEIYESKSKNGILGEYFLCKHLENKFGSLQNYSIKGESSIFCQHIYKKYNQKFPNIRPCSKFGNDAFGCDYKVTGPNRTYYYDAKATNNHALEPFYMSKGEKDLLNAAKNSNGRKIYVIYRVYHVTNNVGINIYQSNETTNGINNNNKAFDPIKMFKVSPNKPKN